MVIFLEWKEIYWSLCMEWICPDTNSKKKVKISSSCDLETPIRPRVKSLNRQIWRLVKEAYMIRYDWIPRARWISFYNIRFQISRANGWIGLPVKGKQDEEEGNWLTTSLVSVCWLKSCKWESRLCRLPSFYWFPTLGTLPSAPRKPTNLEPCRSKTKSLERSEKNIQRKI